MCEVSELHFILQAEETSYICLKNVTKLVILFLTAINPA